MLRSFPFTSESVTEGHPDKIADQISDSVLDAVIAADPGGRVACETLVNTGLIVVSGEITTKTTSISQDRSRDGPRDRLRPREYGFDCNTCGIIVTVDKQSPDIAQGVDEAYESRHLRATRTLDVAGAGDQGMMFGYATNETPELMPFPIALAPPRRRTALGGAQGGVLDYLRPDGKTQVSIRYRSARAAGRDREAPDLDAALRGGRARSDQRRPVGARRRPGPAEATCMTERGSADRRGSSSIRPASSSSAVRWATAA